jgi:vacuolar-type H+-ATPase subunit E/Vma4
MALRDVLERIVHDGETNLATIKQATEKTVREIKEQAHAEDTALVQEAESLRVRRCEKIRERILADARRKARFLHEQHMQQAIHRVGESLCATIAHMDKEMYAAYIRSTLTEMGAHAQYATYTVTPERAEETRSILLAHGIDAQKITTANESGLFGGYTASTETRTYTATLAQYAQDILETSKPAIAAHCIKIVQKKHEG